jgi:tetratricopeptide (TPR) repeat protein
LVVQRAGYATEEALKVKHARNETLLRRSLEQDGASVHNLVHLAHALGATGRAQDGEELVSRAIELEKGEGEGTRTTLLAELHVLRSMFRVVLLNGFGAERDVEAAARLWPEWAVPHSLLAEAKLQAGDDAGAWEAVGRARAAQFLGSTAGISVRLIQSNLEWTTGLLLLEEKRSEEAATHFRRALEIKPTNLAARLRFGQFLLDDGQFDAAREVLEPAGEDQAALAHFVDVASAIALARAMTGDMDGAAACLAPLLDIFTTELDGAEDVGAAELAAAALQAGHASASRNLLTLFERTLAPAA